MDEQGNPVLDKNGKQAYRAVSTTRWSSKEMLIYLRKNWKIGAMKSLKKKDYLFGSMHVLSKNGNSPNSDDS